MAVPVKNSVLATRLLRDGIVSSFFSFFRCVALSQRRDGPEFLRALSAKTKVRRTLHQKQKSPLGPRSPATENEGVSHTSPTTEKAPAGAPAAPAPVGFDRGPHPFRRSWRPLQPEHLLRVGRLLWSRSRCGLSSLLNPSGTKCKIFSTRARILKQSGYSKRSR